MPHNRKIYSLLVVTALIGCFAYGGHTAPFIFFMLLILPFISGSALLISYLFIKLNVTTIYGGLTMRKSECTVKIEAENNSLFPLSICAAIIADDSFLDILNDAFFTEGTKAVKKKLSRKRLGTMKYRGRNFALPPLGKIEMSFFKKFDFSGEYEYGPSFIYFYDVFGIWRVKKSLKMSKKIKVIPRIITSESETPRTFSDDEKENFNVFAFTPEVSSSYFNREYVQGDNIKFLNHKLSAKKDTLIIRQNEPAGGGDITIFCIFTKNQSYEEFLESKEFLSASVTEKPLLLDNYKNSLECSDATAEMAISLSSAAVANGNEVKVYFSDKELRIKTEDDLYLLAESYGDISPNVCETAENPSENREYTLEEITKLIPYDSPFFVIASELDEELEERLREAKLVSRPNTYLLVFGQDDNETKNLDKISVKYINPAYPIYSA